MVDSKAWTYSVTAEPDCPPVSLGVVKSYLRVSGAAQDSEITLLISAATNFAEQFTRRCFINRTITTFRNEFADEFELRRSPLSSVTTVKYLVDGSLSTVSSDVYYNTLESEYSVIALNVGEAWPVDGDVRQQAVEIEFVAGYGADERSVPDDVKVAIMQHVAAMMENRGDCSLSDSLPSTARVIYIKNRIMDIKV